MKIARGIWNMALFLALVLLTSSLAAVPVGIAYLAGMPDAWFLPSWVALSFAGAAGVLVYEVWSDGTLSDWLHALRQRGLRGRTEHPNI